MAASDPRADIPTGSGVAAPRRYRRSALRYVGPMPLGWVLFAISSVTTGPGADDARAPRDELAKRLRAFEEDRSYPLPTRSDIDAADQVLARQPCIGKLNKWHRRYAGRIDWQNGRVDRDVLWFSFRQAGLYGYEAGRKVGRLADIAEIDDRQFRLASGTYNLRTRQVSFDSCGTNWPKDWQRQSEMARH